jgi:hypothetical protein
MKKYKFLFIVIFFFGIISLFALEFELRATDLIKEEILNVKQATVLPTITVAITPVFSKEDFSIITNSFERYNRGTLIVHSPLQVNEFIGQKSYSSCEKIGNMFPFEDFNNELCLVPFCHNADNSNGVIRDFRSNYQNYFLLGGNSRTIEESIKHTMEQFKLEALSVPGKVFTLYHIKALPDFKDGFQRSYINYHDIDNDNVLLIFNNPFLMDVITISRIKAKRVWIFNNGCSLKIGHIDSNCKLTIVNFRKSTIEIGSSGCQTAINSKLSVQLNYALNKFGFTSSNNESIIDNEETTRILYRWNDEENFREVPNEGFFKSYCNSNALNLMETHSENLILKIDVSEEWYKFPAGDYSSTLYFTIESL